MVVFIKNETGTKQLKIPKINFTIFSSTNFLLIDVATTKLSETINKNCTVESAMSIASKIIFC